MEEELNKPGKNDKFVKSFFKLSCKLLKRSLLSTYILKQFFKNLSNLFLLLCKLISFAYIYYITYQKYFATIFLNSVGISPPTRPFLLAQGPRISPFW